MKKKQFRPVEALILAVGPEKVLIFYPDVMS